MSKNDIFNLIRNAVNMHNDRDSLERFKNLCRKFINELEKENNFDTADFISCFIGDIKKQVIEPLEDLSNIPLNNVKYLKITRENVKQLKQLDKNISIGAALLFDYDKIVAYMPLMYLKRLIESNYINAVAVNTDTFLNSDMYMKVRQELRA